MRDHGNLHTGLPELSGLGGDSNSVTKDPVSAFSETLKLCAYGRWGSRKTLQIASLIREFGSENVVIVNCEGGLGTIESSVNPANVIRVPDLSELRSAYGRCVKEFNRPDAWVCLDGMSQVMKWIANEQWKGADAYYDQMVSGLPIDPALKEFGRFITGKDEIDPQKIYGRIGRDSEVLLSAWIRLKSNIYATYLEDLTGSANREKCIPWGPDVPGKMGLNAVMSSFDCVFRMSYDKESRIVAGLNPTGNLYLSRTRDDRNATGLAIPNEIQDFDLGRFITQYLRHTS